MHTLRILALVTALCTAPTLGCHPKEVEVDSGNGENQDAGAPSLRRKRQISNQRQLGLEDFFVSCMQSYQRFRLIDIRTIVSFTIDQTQWFESSDLRFCASDTVTCWRNILYGYMDRNSELFLPALQCIDRYGVYRGRPSNLVPALPHLYMTAPRRRYKRHPHPSLPIDQQTAASQLRQSLPGYQGDFRSLITFFQDDTLCSSEFCDCTGILLPPGESCGENWYTKLGAMTRASSPLRAQLVFAINSITSAGIAQQELDRRRAQQQRILHAIFAVHLLNQIRATTTVPTTTISTITGAMTSNTTATGMIP